MGSFPVVLLLCSFQALTVIAQTQPTEAPGNAIPPECREEMYPCTRMYSVHKPIKRCIGGLCLYSLPRVYVINNEICVRTVCREDEYLKVDDARECSLTSRSIRQLDFEAELCRELSGWPRRIQRSSNSKRCRNRRGNPQTWANKA